MTFTSIIAFALYIFVACGFGVVGVLQTMENKSRRHFNWWFALCFLLLVASPIVKNFLEIL